VLGNPSECVNNQPDEPLVEYRVPSFTVGLFDSLAARYEPVLRFDTAEKWRPLNIESFFGENQHHLCEEGGACESAPLTGSVDLNKKRNSKAYIDIAGSQTSEGGSDYRSPYSECTSSGLRDCDTGPRSAIYYRNAGVYGGYEYIDYWYFYRANYFWESFDFHEGDWEGATIAPSLNSDTFDYAAFTQHGTYFAYARGVLRCEDEPQSSELPPAGSCGTTGWRVDDLPANGTHANYTTPCSEKIFMGWFLNECSSNNGIEEWERGYDGTKIWGNAFYDPSVSLLKMPSLGTQGWIDWPGKWGSPGTGEEGSGPASPGNQTFKIECAHLNNEVGCETGPRTASLTGGVPRRWHRATSPGLTAVSCGNWAGAGIAAVACNPKALRHAVLHGQVGTNADMKLKVQDLPGLTGGGAGVVQVASEHALRDGSYLGIDGNLTPETEVLVRARDRRHRLFLARFKPRVPSRYARTARSNRFRLRLRVTSSANGHPILYLGRARATSVRPLPQ
jgi:hypothetical protein